MPKGDVPPCSRVLTPAGRRAQDVPQLGAGPPWLWVSPHWPAHPDKLVRLHLRRHHARPRAICVALGSPRVGHPSWLGAAVNPRWVRLFSLFYGGIARSSESTGISLGPPTRRVLAPGHGRHQQQIRFSSAVVGGRRGDARSPRRACSRRHKHRPASDRWHEVSAARVASVRRRPATRWCMPRTSRPPS